MKRTRTIGLTWIVFVLLALAAAPSATAAGRATQGSGGRAAAQEPASADLAGTYNLVTVDGHELPYAITHEGTPGPTVVGGSLTLNKDATFVASFSFGGPNGETMKRDLKGTYVKDGADLDLAWEGAGHTKVTVDGKKLTMNNEGILWAFKK